MIDIVVVFSSSLVGLLIARLIICNQRSKQLLYFQLAMFVEDMTSNLNFARLSLSAMCEKYIKLEQPNIVAILQGQKVNCKLTANERQCIESFSQGLVANNSDILTKHLSHYGKEFSGKYTYHKKHNDTVATVYLKVGLLLGAVVGLLLI